MYKSRKYREGSKIDKKTGMYSTSDCRYYKAENYIVQCDINMTENYTNISKYPNTEYLCVRRE